MSTQLEQLLTFQPYLEYDLTKLDEEVIEILYLEHYAELEKVWNWLKPEAWAMYRSMDVTDQPEIIELSRLIKALRKDVIYYKNNS